VWVYLVFVFEKKNREKSVSSSSSLDLSLPIKLGLEEYNTKYGLADSRVVTFGFFFSFRACMNPTF